MKIQQAFIFGFGKWVDYSIDFSSHSFVCIYGDNESGKSTIQKFILFVLFGLPPKQRAFYRPKTSGKMGGRLTIYEPSIGKYTIERIDGVRNGAAKCYLPDGNVYDEEWLNHRLKGMTNDLYHSIFSFSAVDLKEFKNMKDDDLSDVLLSIGLSGANNIYSIEKRLDNKIGNLFKPYGKVPIINKQLDSLDLLFHELMESKKNEATYRDKQIKKSTLISEINHLQSTLNEEKEALLFIEKLHQSLPIINDYYMYHNQLADYPIEIDFPENGIDRLVLLKEKLLPLQSELAILERDQAIEEDKYKDIEKRLIEESIYDEALEINHNKHQYTEFKQGLIKHQQGIKKLEMEINTELTKLNIRLTEDDLELIQFTFYTEKMWNEIKNNIEQVNLEKEQLSQEKNTLSRQQKNLKNQLKDIETNLLTDDQLISFQQQVDNYRKYHYIENLNKESRWDEQQWEKKKKNKDRNITYLLTISIVFALIFTVAAFLFETSFLYQLTVITLVIGIGQYILGKRSIKETEEMILYKNDVRKQIPFVTEDEKKQAEDRLEMNDANQNDIIAIRNQSKSIYIQLIKLEEKENSLEQRINQLNQQIQGQYQDYSFLKYVDVIYWPELYHTVKHLIRLQSEKKQHQREYEQIKNKVTLFENAVSRLINKIDKELLHHQSVDGQLKKIERLIDTQRNHQALLAQGLDVMNTNKSQREDIEQKVNIYEKEIDKLFNKASVQTEDEYYKKANRKNKKDSLEDQLKKVKEQLVAILPQFEVKEIMEDQPDLSSLKLDHEQVKAKIKENELNIDVNRQQLADLNAELVQMESSESHSKMLHRYTMEQEQLNKLAYDWAVLKTAKEMLAETKQTYRNKYLNRIIKQTEIYFNKITGNAYRAIFPPVNNTTFQVESHDHIRYQVNELSEGTIDQLYISLRLAISKMMSKKHCLPFIIDDAFVHFDTIRTKRMMEVLDSIASDQQIILFTCKKEIVKSLSTDQVLPLTNTLQMTK